MATRSARRRSGKSPAGIGWDLQALQPRRDHLGARRIVFDGQDVLLARELTGLITTRVQAGPAE